MYTEHNEHDVVI